MSHLSLGTDADVTLHGDVAGHALCCHGFFDTEVGESIFPEHAACVQVGSQEPTFPCQGLGMGERNIQNETEAREQRIVCQVSRRGMEEWGYVRTCLGVRHFMLVD